ncbi:MAG: ABC transporter permease [Patescibacteria group bacterium]|nr:ABC transporter permease [Patescibacteria group bacterium]MDD5715257.1 ABC transporter permease [Patescibacteria group bacterium]
MGAIWTICKKELRDTIRDRRTLMTAIVMPIVFMPLIMIGSIKLQESQQKSAVEQVAQVAISDEAAAPALVEFLDNQDKIELKDAPENFQEKIAAGELQTYLQVPADFQEQIAAGEPVTLNIYARSTDQKSLNAAQKVEAALALYRESITIGKLDEAGVNPGVLHSIVITRQDIASEQERGGYFLGLLLPMFIVLFSIMGGMYVAIDVSAGEKERKTLESILVTPLSRLSIVTGKFTAVATTAITSVVLSVGSMYAAFKLWPPNFGEAVAFDITLTTSLLMLGIGIILSVMFAGMLLAVAIFAKSYKEAQNYVTPFYLLAILPVSIFTSIPGFKPPLALYFVPPLNAVFVFKESLMGETSGLHVGITILVLLAAAAASIYIATKIFSREGVLFRD